MTTQDLMEALNRTDERWLLEAEERLKLKTRRISRRKLSYALLVAAALVFLLGCAAVLSHLRAEVPENGVHYTVTDAGGIHDINLPDTAMVVRVDCEAQGRLPVLRPGWLPEGLPEPGTAAGLDYSLLRLLRDGSELELYPGWRVRPFETLLAEAGLTAEEAECWYVGYHWEKPNAALLEIRAMDCCSIHERDLLLGMDGGTAELVAEGTRGSYEMLEIRVDYTDFYEASGHPRPAAESVKNYLFLFEPQEQYLLFLGGSDSDYSFETLEKIADGLEVRLTGLVFGERTGSWPYCMLDLGRG